MRSANSPPQRSTTMTSAPSAPACSRSESRQRGRKSPPAPDAMTIEMEGFDCIIKMALLESVLVLDYVGFELAAVFGPAWAVECSVRGEAIGGRVGRRQGVV